MNTPPTHVNPASLQVGVAGAHPVGPLLAMVLRDYGRHRVVGWRLQPDAIPDVELASRWERLPIAECPDPGALVRLSEIIFLTEPVLCADIAQASDWEGTHPPVVLVTQTPRVQIRLVALRLRGRNPLGYSPLPADAHLDELASPDQLWIATQNPGLRDLLERVWRPISNRMPVARVGFSAVSETGLLCLPSASDGPGGVSSQVAPSVASESQRDTPG